MAQYLYILGKSHIYDVFFFMSCVTSAQCAITYLTGTTYQRTVELFLHLCYLLYCCFLTLFLIFLFLYILMRHFCAFCTYFLCLLYLLCLLCKFTHLCLFSALCFLHGELHFKEVSSHISKERKKVPKMHWKQLKRQIWCTDAHKAAPRPGSASYVAVQCVMLLQTVMTPLLFNLQTRRFQYL